MDLGTIPPGLMLMLVLSSVDRETLSGFDRVELVKARSRLIAHLQAELLADVEAVSEATDELGNRDQPDPDQVFETTVSELRAALCLTRRSAEVQTDLAFQLCERVPVVWEALHAGLIDLPRARVLCDQTGHLPRELAQQVCDRALERAPEQTTGQLRARMQRLIISIDPASAKERYEEKLGERRVISELTEDGTANLLGLDLPPADANAAMRRINRLARSLKTKGDPRSIDQIRADVFLDLLHGRGNTRAGSDRGTVDIRVDLTTLTGLDEKPGEIPGWGPVLADIARQIVTEQPESEWRVTLTEENGEPVAVTTTKRRPTATQKRRIETRNPTCVFPGCRIPAGQCDLDHHQAWTDGGPTTEANLGPLCRHDHRAKHEHGWKLKQTRPGVYQWTSPLGHTYTVKPEEPDPP